MDKTASKPGKSYKRNRKEEVQEKASEGDEKNDTPLKSNLAEVSEKQDSEKAVISEDCSSNWEMNAEMKDTEETSSLDEMKKLEEEEMEILENYISEATKRLNKKIELRSANRVDRNKTEVKGAKLDSSLKRNTAFIKKLRNFTESQSAALSKELSGLNLSRYVGEAASALLEARLKMSDVNSCVDLCSAIHQRYEEFSPALLAGCTKLLKEKQGEKTLNLSKLRVDLRLFTELISNGIFTQKEGLPLLGSCIKNLVSTDKTEHKNVSVIVSFCKFCGEDFIGLLPAKIAALSKKYNREVPKSDFLKSERQKNVCQLMKEYYQSLVEHIKKQHELIQKEERKNRKLLETRGEVDEARLTALANEVSVLEKLVQQTTTLCEYLQEEMPELSQAKVEEGEEGGVVDGSISTIGSSLEAGDIWEDEESKDFYTSLPELKAILPSILFSESEKSSLPEKTEIAVDEANDKEEEEIENEEEDEILDEEDPNQLAEMEEEEENIDGEDKETGSLQKSTQKMAFTHYVDSLTNCVNRSLVDSAAIDFCINYNTKPFRKRLARALFLVNRNRLDLLPFYARLVAALQPLMPDLPQDLIDRLKKDFRYQVKKKHQIYLESKLKVCRYLAELTKFSVFSGMDCLNCFKMLLNDFTHHHIEMACCLLETTGRFLYRSPSTHHRTKVLLEQMMRKKTAFSYEPRYVTMIENAFYYVNPPECTKLTVITLPPMQRFINSIVTDKLSKSTCESTLKIIRKLDWDDEEISDFCVSCLVASWSVKYYNIRFLASLVSGIVMYQEWVGQGVVDGVLEDIRSALESNDPSMNQRRIASCKYLAELYNYRVVDSGVIFKVLYSLITFGVGVENEFDPPEHLIRLRLVATMLLACGAFFSSGLSKKKLDCFLVYFQHYYLIKRTNWEATDSFPFEYDQLVRECLSTLRPKMTVYQTLEESAQGVEQLNNQLMQKAMQQVPELRKVWHGEDDLHTINEEGVEEEDDEEEEDDVRYQNQFVNSQEEENTQTSSKGDPLTADLDDSSSSDEESNEEEEEQQQQPQVNEPEMAPIKCEEDDDFLSAFDKMMSENLVEHSRDARAAPVVLPVAKRSAVKKNYDQLVEESTSSDKEQTEGSGSNCVKFVLMSRSKNVTTIAVPEDSEMVTKMRNREKQEAEERRNVKRMVLEMTERQEEEERAAEILQLRNNVFHSTTSYKEKKPKYQPAKGVPDADTIFGNKHKGPNAPNSSAGSGTFR